jgi:hypothetical protein
MTQGHAASHDVPSVDDHSLDLARSRGLSLIDGLMPVIQDRADRKSDEGAHTCTNSDYGWLQVAEIPSAFIREAGADPSPQTGTCTCTESQTNPGCLRSPERSLIRDT